MKLVQDLVYEARTMAEKLASEESLTHQATNVLNKENEGESLAKICSKSNLFNPHSIIQHVVEAWRENYLSLTFLLVCVVIVKRKNRAKISSHKLAPW